MFFFLIDAIQKRIHTAIFEKLPVILRIIKNEPSIRNKILLEMRFSRKSKFTSEKTAD